MAAPNRPPRDEIPISWVGYDDVPIAYANQFLLQYQPEGSFVVGLGQATPPALIGSSDELASQIDQIEFVPVRTLARIALTESKMKELVAVLQASIEKAEQIRQMIDPRGGEPT